MSGPAPANVTRLEAAIGRLNHAQLQAADELERTFPPGTDIRWRHGNATREGTVQDIDRAGRRLRVKSDSGRASWVDLTDLELGSAG